MILVTKKSEFVPDITKILQKIERGDRSVANELLTLVYAELRHLARAKLRSESSGQTLQPTALVHEAYVRLVDGSNPSAFENRAHFYASAAEAMRRILIENARRKQSEKHGGKLNRVEIDEGDAIIDSSEFDELLDLDSALQKLEDEEPELARLISLRYFAGLTIDETAKILGMSPRTVTRNWTFARAWLGREMEVASK